MNHSEHQCTNELKELGKPLGMIITENPNGGWYVLHELTTVEALAFPRDGTYRVIVTPSEISESGTVHNPHDIVAWFHERVKHLINAKDWVKELEPLNNELRRHVPFTAYEFEETNYPIPNTRVNYFPSPSTIIQVLKENNEYELWHWTAVNDELNAPLDLYDNRKFEMPYGSSIGFHSLEAVVKYVREQFAPITGRKKT